MGPKWKEVDVSCVAGSGSVVILAGEDEYLRVAQFGDFMHFDTYTKGDDRLVGSMMLAVRLINRVDCE